MPWRTDLAAGPPRPCADEPKAAAGGTSETLRQQSLRKGPRPAPGDAKTRQTQRTAPVANTADALPSWLLRQVSGRSDACGRMRKAHELGHSPEY